VQAGLHHPDFHLVHIDYLVDDHDHADQPHLVHIDHLHGARHDLDLDPGTCNHAALPGYYIYRQRRSRDRQR
jgi:hypothetical protein